jgi:hypothetical protein
VLEATDKYIGVFCEIRTKYTKLTAKHLGVILEAGEDQQQITALLRVVTERATPPLLSSKRGPHFKTDNGLGKNKNMITDSEGTQNQKLLWWRRPAAYYCLALQCSAL